MALLTNRGPAWAFIALLPLLAGCPVPTIDLSEESAAAVRAQDLEDLPYHPLVMHLDLSILAYQNYSQSLVWGFDPYYEDLDNLSWDRSDFMDIVQGWAGRTGARQVADGVGIEAYRGPGRLAGFEDNPTHDPLIYQYSRLHPWSSSVTNALFAWTEYLTPVQITDRIAEVQVCSRALGEPEGSVSVEPVTLGHPDGLASARDVLMAFEGGTGDKGEEGQPASQSLMGYALLRAGEGDDYDIHISFRGSRSGSGERAALQALSTEGAIGNPDWITDLGYREVSAPFISDDGEVSRGMSRAVQTAFPQLFGCLDELVGARRSQPPKRVWITGHSLGGGLAQQLASAVLVGDEYGPSGDGMPTSLQGWPWQQLKLVTFGAPRVGNEAWARPLTEEHLDSDFFEDTQDSSYDQDAISFLDPDIIPRLLDPDRPAAYRVLLPSDPITTDLIADGSHVGKSVYLAQPVSGDPSALLDFSAHEPRLEREAMVEVFDDPRIPPEAWIDHDLEWLVPDRIDEDRGTEAEYRKLAEGAQAYYLDGDITFDHDAFDASWAVFAELLSEL